jgi:butyrate kinase
MRTVRQFLALLLSMLTVPAGSAFAGQRHVVDPSQLAAAVAQRVAAQDADRAVIRDTLARPEVRDVAARLGVDMTRMTAAVDTLSAAATARQVDGELTGGASTITLSTTTIIIVLLVFIVLILALK